MDWKNVKAHYGIVMLAFGLVACTRAHYQGVVTAKTYSPCNFDFNVELDNGREEIVVRQADYIQLRVGMHVAVTEPALGDDAEVTILQATAHDQPALASAVVPHG